MIHSISVPAESNISRLKAISEGSAGVRQAYAQYLEGVVFPRPESDDVTHRDSAKLSTADAH